MSTCYPAEQNWRQTYECANIEVTGCESCYWIALGDFFSFFSFKVIFFVIILLYLVSLQKIVMKSYSAPEQLQNSVFKKAHLVLDAFG